MEETSGNAWEPDAVKGFYEMLQRFECEARTEICKIFLSALDTGNHPKLFEIGNAIEVLRKVATEAEQKGDKFRADVLYWKSILEPRGEQWTIRKLARKIGWPASDAENGFWTLRRIATELSFPIKESTQISDE